MRIPDVRKYGRRKNHGQGQERQERYQKETFQNVEGKAGSQAAEENGEDRRDLSPSAAPAASAIPITHTGRASPGGSTAGIGGIPGVQQYFLLVWSGERIGAFANYFTCHFIQPAHGIRFYAGALKTRWKIILPHAQPPLLPEFSKQERASKRVYTVL